VFFFFCFAGKDFFAVEQAFIEHTKILAATFFIPLFARIYAAASVYFYMLEKNYNSFFFLLFYLPCHYAAINNNFFFNPCACEFAC